MKVLFVCADRYPKAGACTNLLNKLFFEGGLLESNEIHVATYKYCLEDKSEENYNGVAVHRFLSTRFISQSELRKKPIRVWLLWKGTLNKIQRKFTSMLFKERELDLGRIAEYKKFLLQLCKNNGYEIIVGVAGCYELAIAAKDVAIEQSIKYVLYQVDPFTDNALYNIDYAGLRYKVEKDLYLSAEKVFTTQLILSKMIERMKGKKLSNVEIMEFPGVSVDSKRENRAKEKKKNINCVFAGRVYAGVRNPTYTIECFRRLPPNVNLNLYGVSETELKKLFSISSLPNNVKCYGLVSVEESEKAIQNSDVLVNIGNIMLNQVPSKLFSYISTGKPILNICANHNCPSKQYLALYPCALSVDEDSYCDDLTARNVLNFLIENSGKVCDINTIERLYKKCTPVYAAKQMQAAFECAYEVK